MTSLVFVDNNRPVTDSLMVAETFKKRHGDVLRSYDNLDCSPDFNERNFASVDYIDSKGETRRKIIMTKDGFSFMVFGYTGKEAAQFKEMYISEFGKMADQLGSKIEVLSERRALIQSLKLTAELAEEVEEIKDITTNHGQKLIELEAKVEEQITMDSGEQRKVQRLIAHKVYSIANEKPERNLLFKEIYREIKDRWGVASYRDVRRHEVEGLIKYIEAWKPRAA